MNEYNYKPKENHLPKLNLTSLTTHYKSFYTNFSKDKSNSSNYNTQRVKTTTNNNSSLFSSRINSNDPTKIHSKGIKNIFDAKKKMNRKKKIKLDTLYLTEISKNETDDNYFAMSEIRRIDNTIKKRINKEMIWNKKSQNIYDIFTSKNRQDIKNIKNKVRQNLSGLNINLRKEIMKNNYFASDNIETIHEAKSIIQRIKLNILQNKNVNKKFNHYNKIDLHTFRNQNRDISLKNILINIIKSESNKLKTKENIVYKALKEANQDFVKDEENFEILTKNEMINFRKKEMKLDEEIKKNRVLVDEIKKINSELHGTRDEVRKYIKDIIIYIKYEDFIKKMIAKSKDDSYENKRNIIKYNQMGNDKDFDILIKNIIKEYYADNYNNKLILTEDITPQTIVNLFISMESNIINALEARDLIMKEINEDKRRYEIILNDLRLKVEQNKKELDILHKEMNIFYDLSLPRKDIKDVLDETNNYFQILYKELSKYIKDKAIFRPENLSFNIFKLLHILQDKLLAVVNELEQISENDENSEIFKEAIEKIKLENKKEKQKTKKSLAKKLLEEKHNKLKQRMLRFKPKGPITFPPPWALNKSKRKKKIIKDVNAENEEILFYK